MFVDPSMRPKFPLLKKGMLESLMDETDQVSALALALPASHVTSHVISHVICHVTSHVTWLVGQAR